MLTRSKYRSHSSESEGSHAADEGSQPSFSQASLQSDSAPLEEVAGKKRKQGRGRGFKRKPDQWVCVAPKSFPQGSVSVLSLRHPSSNVVSKFMLREADADGECCQICEILKFSDDPRSWFLGNTVHTDGGLYLCTPVDPLFLALPYFQVAAAKSGKFTTLDAILADDDECDCFRIISKCVAVGQWANISEEKDIGSGMMVYRFSRDKTLVWLQKKVLALADALEKEEVYVGRGSQSSMLTSRSQVSQATRCDFLSFACGMVQDYLSKDLGQEIACLYSISDEPKQTAGGGEPPAKRRHLDNSEPLEDYSHGAGKMAPPTEASKQTASQKSLAKIDKTGIKQLSSFFKKKAVKPKT